MNDKRSDITGEGHGSKHAWKYQRDLNRQTLYECIDCGVSFWHNYPRVEDIFEAMQISGVPAECEPKTEAVKAVRDKIEMEWG